MADDLTDYLLFLHHREQNACGQGGIVPFPNKIDAASLKTKQTNNSPLPPPAQLPNHTFDPSVGKSMDPA